RMERQPPFFLGVVFPFADLLVMPAQTLGKNVILPQCTTFSTYCQDKSFRKGVRGKNPFA
ncbi:MAG: hypothetical protein L3V56_11800, partial [Candidatus Magnetoovum sp. WYHC-5]|nr:hypothetical protein [Candidatus Magnetoovum sp. WYHC-5]